MDLRKDFFDNMCELAEKDKDVVLIVGDLGFSFMEEYAKKFPDQFINAGCIEQSMVGIAAGMARIGKKPYVYSNTIFLLYRALEQIRDDVAYNKTNVKLIGTGAAGFLGFSHNLIFEKEEGVLNGLNIVFARPENKDQLRRAMEINSCAFIRI